MSANIAGTVKEKYGEAARRATAGEPSACCGASCCDKEGSTDPITKDLYDEAQKRYNDAQAVNVHGGYSAIMVNEIPVIADDDCPRTYAFGLNKESFRWFELASPGWMEQGGGGIFHLRDGSVAGTKQAIWQAWFSWYAELGCVAPNRNGVLKFCEDDVPTGEGEV